MNETVKEYIEVMNGYLEGKPIQSRVRTAGSTWIDVNFEPSWSWGDYEYRIKPITMKDHLIFVLNNIRTLHLGTGGVGAIDDIIRCLTDKNYADSLYEEHK